jgi:hypothetical protein
LVKREKVISDFIKFNTVLELIENANNLASYKQIANKKVINQLLADQLSAIEGLKQIISLQEQINEINCARIKKIKKILRENYARSSSRSNY